MKPQNSFQTQLKTRSFTSDKPRIAWFYYDWSANPYRQERDLYGGIGYYRVFGPAKPLQKYFDIELIGKDFTSWGTIDETYTRLGRDYDLIISKHVINGQTASNLLATAEHFGRKLIVDIDDNYFDIRKENKASADYDIGKQGRYVIGTFLEKANGLTVSTDPLKKLYTKLNKKIDVLPNCVDLSEWPTQKTDYEDGKIRIGFSGGTGHNSDLDIILEPMAYILAKYPQVNFEVCSAITPQEAMAMAVKMNEFCKKNVAGQFRMTGGTDGGVWQGYPQLLNSFGWDIILAPLVDDKFNQCKSHIRWMENSLVFAPTVASPVYPYVADIGKTHTIQDGITGMVATTAEDWFDKLSFLIEHPDARKQIASNAYNYIKDNWTYEQHADKYKKVIEKYL